MIDQLKSMAIFASVVEEATFRGAAKKLAISPAIVSIHIKKLEEQIGAPLFYRSTRRVTLTQDGKAFYQAAKAMMSSARDGLEQFSSKARIHLTELRIAMPETLVTNPVFEKLTAFAKNHSGIRLNLISTDKRQSIIGEGHDVAIRMGKFEDSDLKIKRIGEDKRVLVAAPSYMKDRPKPDHPRDLMESAFVSFSLVPESIHLKYKKMKVQNIWGKTMAKASSAQTVRFLCIAGLGIAALPYHEVKRDIDLGHLELVLPEWSDMTVLPIFLVWTRNADLNVATREFINFMSRG